MGGPVVKPIPVGPRVDGWHRYWFGEQGPYLSVTTATTVLDKPGVDTWRVNQAIDYMANHHVDPSTDDRTIEEIRREVKAATEGIRVDSADFGTEVHRLIDEWWSGTEHPVVAIGSDEEKFLWAFGSFLDYYGIKREDAVAHELAVFNDLNMTAGRLDLDLIARERMALELGIEPGAIVRIDYKSGKAIYGETELQLAGYTDCTYSGRPNDPNKYVIAQPTAHAVLHIRPHEYEGGYPIGFRLAPYTVTEQSIERFRACVLLKRWQQDQDRQYRAARKEAA